MLTHVQASVRVIDLTDNKEIVPPFFLEKVSDIDAETSETAFRQAARKSLYGNIFHFLKDILHLDLSIKRPEHESYSVRINDLVATPLTKETLQ